MYRHKLSTSTRQSSSSEALALTMIIIPVANIFFLRKPAVHMRLIIIYLQFLESSMHRGTYNQPNRWLFSWLLCRLSQCPFNGGREPVDLDIPTNFTLLFLDYDLLYNFYLNTYHLILKCSFLLPIYFSLITSIIILQRFYCW